MELRYSLVPGTVKNNRMNLTDRPLNRSLDTLICRIILSNIWQSAASPYIKEAQKAAKLLNKNLVFKSTLLIVTVSRNAFHSTNSFCCFSRCQAPTTHNPQFLDSLRRRANARNVSFRISLRWPIHIINPVDKTKLSCNTPTDTAPQFL